jgi:predicted permease
LLKHVENWLQGRPSNQSWTGVGIFNNKHVTFSQSRMVLVQSLAGVAQDLKFAVRQLRRTPAFAVVAILTLALGIGANAAVFSVMNAVMLRYLPVPDPQRLVLLHYTNQPENTGQTGYDDTSLSEPVFASLRQESGVFSDLVAFVPLGIPKIAVRIGDEAEEAAVDEVSGNFFSGLGVRIARGRGFEMEDEKRHAQLAVLSYGYWTSRFGRNPSALGQTIFIKGVPFTIAGVASPEFVGLERGKATDVWVPFQSNPQLKPWGTSAQDKQALYGSPDWFFLMTVGRLRPGMTLERAEAQLKPVYKQAIVDSLGQPKPGDSPSDLHLTPARGVEGVNDSYKEPLAALMVMVGLVLLSACGNVAMLLVARNAGREREFSVRMALGASRGVLFRQLLTESLLLVTAGGLMGWGFAVLATHTLANWSAMEVSLSPDWRVLAFALVLCAASAFVFGIAPLRNATRTASAAALTTGALASQQSKKKIRAGQLVLAAQISLCLMLLAGSGLLVRTLANLENANLGLQAKGLLVFGIAPPATLRSDAEAVQFYTQVQARLRALPAVESATLMSNRLGGGWSNNTSVFVDGVVPTGKKFAGIRWNAVGPDFFHALKVPLLLGRDFTEADTAAAPRVAIVNQTFAEQYVKDPNKLGHHIKRLGNDAEDANEYAIIGVVADSRYTSVREKTRPMAYFPFTQISGISTMQFALRVHGRPTSLLPEVRKAVREFGPDLSLLQPIEQQDQFDTTYTDERMFARLSVFFGMLAALLVATGLYGTMAYRVSRRTPEIGVRMALGAQRGQVLWMVLRESLMICAAGILIGLPVAIACSRLLRSMLFNLSPFDPLSFTIALAGVCLVTLIATAIPARRASSVNPIIALRYE